MLIWGRGGFRENLSFKFENQENSSPILQTKNPLEILKTFFTSEKIFSKALNKKFNSNTRIYTEDTKSSTCQNSDICQDSDIFQNSDTFFGLTKVSL